MACKFCHTGTQNLVRNLESSEIIGQIMLAKDVFGEWPPQESTRLSHITNIVLMGMGEPLYNYPNVARALKMVMSPDGLGISRTRITLSTSGVVPMIQRCGEELGVNLAISLHAVRDDLRDILVPVNKRYPLETLLDACRQYPHTNSFNRITFEYVMLHDVNDSDSDARELIRLLKNIPAKVNLIPFNTWPGANFTCSTPTRIARFAAILETAGYASPIRRPRGSDILAACGQLKSASQKPVANLEPANSHVPSTNLNLGALS